MNIEAKVLAKVVDALTTSKPAYLPSDAWDAVVREGSVITTEKADAIKAAIKAAPEATVARVFQQVIGIFGGLLS